MYHELPAGGMMNHGFFTYSPKFFYRLCAQNNYEVIFLKIVSAGQSPVPEDLFISNRLYANGVQYITVTSVTDFALRATLRKTRSEPFVTPLDVVVKEPSA